MDMVEATPGRAAGVGMDRQLRLHRDLLALTMHRQLQLQRELQAVNEQLRASLGPSERTCRAAPRAVSARGLDLLYRHARFAQALRRATRHEPSASEG
jgi:hypothetical protein